MVPVQQSSRLTNDVVADVIELVSRAPFVWLPCGVPPAWHSISPGRPVIGKPRSIIVIDSQVRIITYLSSLVLLTVDI